MGNVKVTNSDISRYMMSLYESVDEKSGKDCERYYEQAKRTNDRRDIIRFLKECGKSEENAKKYISPCLKYIEDNITDTEIVNIFVNSIVSKFDTAELEELSYCELPENIVSILNTQIMKNAICDRILHNHNVIQGKYDMKGICDKARDIDAVKMSTIKCCETVDHLVSTRYPTKVNSAIEEMFYLLGESFYKYEDVITNTTLSYFLLKEDLQIDDVVHIKTFVDDSPVLDNPVSVSNTFTRIIDKFIQSTDKTEIDFSTMVTTAMACPYYEITSRLPYLLDLFYLVAIGSNARLYEAMITEVIPGLPENIEKKSTESYYRNYIDSLYISMKEFADITVHRMSSKYGEAKNIDNVNRFVSALNEVISWLDEQKKLAYTHYNIECMRYNVNLESVNVVTLNEFKMFGFNNMLNAIRKIDRYLAKKLNGMVNRVKDKVKTVKSKIFEDCSLIDMINPDQSVDCCVASFEIKDGAENDAHEILTDLCKDINKNVIGNSSLMTYYVINPDNAEIRLKDTSTMVGIFDDSEDLEDPIYNSIDTDRINAIQANGDLCDTIDPEMDITKEAKNIFKENINYELFNLFIEAASIAGIDKNIIEDLYETALIYNPVNESSLYFKSDSIVKAYEAYEDLPFEIQAKAYSIAQSILEDAKDEKEDSVKDKVKNSTSNIKDKVKNTASKINKIGNTAAKEKEEKQEAPKMSPINSIKLYLDGLKKKTRDLSAKEQQISRNADVAFNNFAKSVKNTLVSDRRESIIKGSVIPSFSKSIKLGIGLAGIAAVNPPLGIITAIGGLAASKNLTKKERALLLDEIDVELEVLEKEIQIAESNNQLKKLRKLMMMKKDLQRQYQRIKVNARIGKDLLPGNTVGRKQYSN